MCHFSFRNVVFDNEMKVLLVFRRHGITALFTDTPVVVNGSGLSHSTGIRTSGAARGPSKGSLALILPTAWVPSAHKAADGHAFRRPRPPGSLLHGYVRRGRRQRSVPARSGASQFASRAPPPTGHETMTEDQTVTQAAVVGTQAANCGAPERTRPTY